MFRDQLLLLPSEAVARSDRHMLARYQTSRGQRRLGASRHCLVAGKSESFTGSY